MNTISIRNSLLSAFGFAVLAISSPEAFADTTVTGASYKDPDTQQEVSISQQNNGTWVENSPNGPFTFQLVARDENSIYLLDKTRGFALQIDLHRKLISWGVADANNMIGQKIGSYTLTSFDIVTE